MLVERGAQGVVDGDRADSDQEKDASAAQKRREERRAQAS